MTQNYSFKSYNCEYCKYTTKRNYNLIRHLNAKHNNNINQNNKIINNEQNVHPSGQNVHPKGQNVHLKENLFNCKKCYKTYKTKKNLLIHENKCNGVDELTCPKCMISFTTRQGKSNHIKKNNCKARSVVYARKNNVENIKTNIENIENIENQNNYNIQNQNIIECQNITNNVYINNYGNERLDYLNYEKMIEIFKKAYDIPSLLTKEIHFNIEFPENNNIKDSDKQNYSLVKINDEYIYKNLNNLVQELINEKAEIMQRFAVENKEDICLKIDTYKYENIIELLLKLVLLKEPSEHYKNQVGNIRDMIRNSNNIS